MDKYEVAQILREIGMIIELTDTNPKKGIAYRKAAHTIESISDLEDAVEKNSLESFPGIGKSLSNMVSTLMKTGSLPYYELLKDRIPNDLLWLAHIPGLGLNKIRILYETFQITNIDELEQLFKKDNVHKLKGFGPSFVKKVLKRISIIKKEGFSLLYPQALRIAQALIEILKKNTDKIEVTGAIRRKCETINQLDLIALSTNPEDCFSFLAKHGLVREILSKEKNLFRVLLKQGIVAHLHVSNKNDYVLDLFRLTGNQRHLDDLKDKILNSKNKKFKSESDIYQDLGLPFIVPELREGRGEVEAARQGKLPHLIEEKDLKGAFHCHTVDSDGHNTIEEMVAEAQDLGWEYLGISDHSKSSYQANGMSEERLFAQIEKIRKLNAQMDRSFQIFAGLECDVLKDGTLDFSNDILAKLDFVIVSVHRYFNLEEDQMTQRLIKAIENPYTTMVGHLTGRLLNQRDPYQLNIPKIIDACIANKKIIELNAYPNRLDMDWRLWIRAKEKGLKCSINPDAHSLVDLQNCSYGIHIARKGWLEKGDVINTLPLAKMRRYLK